MASRYWVGNAGNWNDTAHWSATSGGASGASVPTSSDDVYFDANSCPSASQTITVNVNGTCGAFTVDALSDTATISFSGAFSISFYGNFTHQNSSATYSGAWFISRSSVADQTKTIDANGADIISLDINTADNLYTVNFLSDITLSYWGLDTAGAATYDVIVTTSDGVTITVDFVFACGQFVSNNTTVVFNNTNDSKAFFNLLTAIDNGTNDTSTLDVTMAGVGIVYVYYWYKITVRTLTISSGTELKWADDYTDIGTIIIQSGGILTDASTYNGRTVTVGEMRFVNGGVFEYDEAYFTFDIKEITGSGGYISGSFSDVLGKMPDWNVPPSVAVINKGTTSHLSQVPTLDDSPVGAFVKIYGEDSAVVLRTDKNIANIDYGTKYANSMSREGMYSIHIEQDDFREARDIYKKFNRIEFYETNYKHPLGQLKLRGFIIKHVYDYETKMLDVYVVSKGFITEKTVLQSEPTLDIANTAGTTAYSTLRKNTTGGSWTGAQFTTDDGTELLQIEFATREYGGGYVYKLEIYESSADLEAGATPFATSTNRYINGATYYRGFVFPTLLTVTAYTTYYAKLYWGGNNVYGVRYRSGTGGYLRDYESDTATLHTSYGGTVRYAIYASTADTTFTINSNSFDAIREIKKLANLRSVDFNIDPKNTIPPQFDFLYGFNTNTYGDAIEKLAEQSTQSTVYFYDDVLDTLVFKEINQEPEKVIPVQKMIEPPMYTVDAKQIANQVFFSGGDTGGGVYLYTKYTNEASINEYNQYLHAVISDNRVTSTTTASGIGNRYLNEYSTELLTAQFTIDKRSYIDGDYRIGDSVMITGVDGVGAPSLFDVATFDESAFDYDESDIQSVVWYISAIDEGSEQVKMTLGELPPSLFSTVAYANQKITKIDTQNNDTAPA